MILKVISVTIWLFSVVSIFLYLPTAINAFSHSHLERDATEINIIFLVVISIISTIEIALTFVIRHFALNRPTKRGTFHINTIGGSIRFFIVNFINWSLAESVAIYGMVLYFMHGEIVLFLIFSLIGLVTLLFHVPRFKPYQTDEKSA